MIIQQKVLQKVAANCQGLVTKANSLHLSSIAKCIEMETRCQIFTEAFRDLGPQKGAVSFLGTCEGEFVLDSGKNKEEKTSPFRFKHHFIFYRKCPEDIEVERFRVAHELGHCALHWPLGSRKNRLIYTHCPGAGNMYMVEYNKNEEEEADAFAALISYYTMPERSNVLKVDASFLDKLNEFGRKGLIISSEI